MKKLNMILLIAFLLLSLTSCSSHSYNDDVFDEQLNELDQYADSAYADMEVIYDILIRFTTDINNAYLIDNNNLSVSELAEVTSFSEQEITDVIVNTTMQGKGANLNKDGVLKDVTNGLENIDNANYVRTMVIYNLYFDELDKLDILIKNQTTQTVIEMYEKYPEYARSQFTRDIFVESLELYSFCSKFENFEELQSMIDSYEKNYKQYQEIIFDFDVEENSK